jgi:hypothetical protein
MNRRKRGLEPKAGAACVPLPAVISVRQNRTFRQLMDAVWERLRPRLPTGAIEPEDAGTMDLQQTEWDYFDRNGRRAEPPEGAIRMIEPRRRAQPPVDLPRDRRKISGVPWRLWGLLLTVAGLGFGLFIVDPPPVTYTSPRLEIFSDHATVEFDVTNHSARPANRILTVSVGRMRKSYLLLEQRDHPISPYLVLAQRELPTSLAAKETKHLRCDFALDRGVPSAAEILSLR